MARSALVVDDAPDLREALAVLLALWGYESRLAGRGEIALRMAERDPPDVAIVDLALPDIDGWTVAANLRSRIVPRPYLIALTGHALREHERALSDARFDALVVKPDLAALESILTRIPHQRESN